MIIIYNNTYIYIYHYINYTSEVRCSIILDLLKMSIILGYFPSRMKSYLENEKCTCLKSNCNKFCIRKVLI